MKLDEFFLHTMFTSIVIYTTLSKYNLSVNSNPRFRSSNIMIYNKMQLHTLSPRRHC